MQSYGTRCVRPPILYGDVSPPAADDGRLDPYAQSLTDKPVKGMLTGPVTILAWSFVRDDQPLADTADQSRWRSATRPSTCRRAGIARHPGRRARAARTAAAAHADKAPTCDWAVGAFRLATSGVADSTQIHTHLCYSEFGEVIGAIADLDADVTSIEAARSHMEVLDDLTVGFSNSVGPGVYDIHSPRVPEHRRDHQLIAEAPKAVPAERLWVNPDCGLKTRNSDEVTASLANLVAATKEVRASA